MTIVVGTGPAGLTAAYLLAKQGGPVTVVDSKPRAQAGGLWRGFDYGDTHFETGMHWYTDCGIAEIDGFWRTLLPADQIHEIPREIAGCWWDGRLQANSPYPDVRGGREFHNKPVLEKIWGVPIEDLAPHADQIVKINRAVGYDEATTLAAYDADPRSRDMLAWPDQRTLPERFQSGRKSFYPKQGLRALVNRAIARLGAMGVRFEFSPGYSAIVRQHGEQTLWAAGLKGACDEYGIPWPADMTPARRLTVVNALRRESIGHDLHYTFNYEHHNPFFRTTFYCNFVGDDDPRITFELIDTPIDQVPAVNLHRYEVRILGAHDLGPILPVPTVQNEALLEGVRYHLSRVPNLKIIGSGAEPGMFFQPDVLRHVWKVAVGHTPAVDHHPV